MNRVASSCRSSPALRQPFRWRRTTHPHLAGSRSVRAGRRRTIQGPAGARSDPRATDDAPANWLHRRAESEEFPASSVSARNGRSSARGWRRWRSRTHTRATDRSTRTSLQPKASGRVNAGGDPPVAVCGETDGQPDVGRPACQYGVPRRGVRRGQLLTRHRPVPHTGGRCRGRRRRHLPEAAGVEVDGPALVRRIDRRAPPARRPDPARRATASTAAAVNGWSSNGSNIVPTPSRRGDWLSLRKCPRASTSPSGPSSRSR